MIAIVIDSTAYITSREAYLCGIRVVSASYSVDSRMYNEKFIDVPFDERAVYGTNAKCVTYHPTTVDFLNTFRELDSKGLDIICITMSSKLSSSYNSALLAKKYLPNANIRIVDSDLTVAGLYLLAKKARALAKTGYGIDEIEKKLNEVKKRIKIRFTVDDISALIKSKRIAFVRRSMTPVLNYKPIFIFKDGAIYAERSARVGYDRMRKMVSDIPQNAKLVIINYVEQTIAFNALVSYLKLTRPGLVIEMRKVGPVVGINIGKSALSITWVEN